MSGHSLGDVSVRCTKPRGGPARHGCEQLAVLWDETDVLGLDRADSERELDGLLADSNRP
jgi:hypothetical protein